MPREEEQTLKAIYRNLVAVTRRVPGMENAEERMILVEFPVDQMSYGLGEEILIKPKFEAPGKELPDDSLRSLALNIGHAIWARYPGALVICNLESYGGEVKVHWSSKDEFITTLTRH